MELTEIAAKVMTLGHNGRTDIALELAHEALGGADAAQPLEVAALWYAVAAVHLHEADHPAVVAAADRCLALGRETSSAGWVSNALSMRAMAHVRMQQLDAALHDLAEAEVELDVCDDEALACWAHTGLGNSYMELRLYELAEPHYQSAAALDASPMPLADAGVIDLVNLAELHLRWAEELERAMPHEDSWEEADARRARANHLAVLAVAKARRIDSELVAACQAMELCTRPREAAESSLPELRDAYRSTGHTDQRGSRVLVGGSLARALWRTDRREEALEVARSSAAASVHAGDWQVEAGARWLLTEMECQAGLPGAHSGRDYARLLSRVLWRQRMSTLAGAQATLAVERLRHDKTAAQRAALEDPLTGVGNRRMLDAALRDAELDPSRGGSPTTMLLVDLDDFKAVNDRYGHPFGDRVLHEAAQVIRRTARADDVVARLGGDEFVVLAHGTDAEAGAALADRVATALNRLEVATPHGPWHLTASVGVRTTGDGLELADLLAAADQAMYDNKRGERPAASTA